MNREAVLRIASLLESGKLESMGEPIGFNMQTFLGDALPDRDDKTGFKCNTVACIAGWTCLSAGAVEGHAVDIEYRAKEILDLDWEQAHELFYAWDAGIPRSEITLPLAVATLRHLAETGEVDWNYGLKEKESLQDENTR